MLLVWQFTMVVMTAAIASAFSPDWFSVILTGGLAVWLPNIAVAAAISTSTGLGVVFYAMLRGVVIAISVVATLIVFDPERLAYLIGVASALVAVTIVPPIYEMFYLHLKRTVSS